MTWRDRLPTLRGGPENRTVEADHTPWMITLADLLSLMLTFFVLLFSMNEVLPENWRAVVVSMTEEFNPGRAQVVEEPAEASQAPGRARAPQGLGLGYLENILLAQSGGHAALEVAQIRREGGQLVISMPASLLFGANDATLSGEGAAALAVVGQTLANVRNRVHVGAHTAPGQAAPRPYGDAAAYTIARARAVVARLKSAGYSGPVAALGYGAGQFGALDAGLDLNVRNDLANRVDIVLGSESQNRNEFDGF